MDFVCSCCCCCCCVCVCMEGEKGGRGEGGEIERVPSLENINGNEKNEMLFHCF